VEHGDGLLAYVLFTEQAQAAKYVGSDELISRVRLLKENSQYSRIGHVCK
jgi:hypothetical protein